MERCLRGKFALRAVGGRVDARREEVGSAVIGGARWRLGAKKI